MIHELKPLEALNSFLDGKAVMVATKENEYALSPLELFLKDLTFIIDDEIVKLPDMPAIIKPEEKCATQKKSTRQTIEETKARDAQQEQKEESQETAEKKSKGYYGFLHIRCSKCGKTHTFCSKNRISYHTCPECREKTKLQELKRVYINCECGGLFRYFTNETEELFDLTCLKCGQPVALKYNRKKNLYETIKDTE